MENSFATVTAAHQVITSPCVLDSQWPQHRAIASQRAFLPKTDNSYPHIPAWSGLCVLAIQFDLVPVRIADINRHAVVLLHRFVGKPVSHQSAARLLCLLWRDKESEVLPAPYALVREQREALSAHSEPGLLRPARIEQQPKYIAVERNGCSRSFTSNAISSIPSTAMSSIRFIS